MQNFGQGDLLIPYSKRQLPLTICFFCFLSHSSWANTQDEVELAHGHFLKEVAILKFFPNNVSSSCIDSIQHITKQRGRMNKESPMVRYDILKTLYVNSIEICYPDVETICRINKQQTIQTACQIFFQSLE